MSLAWSCKRENCKCGNGFPWLCSCEVNKTARCSKCNVYLYADKRDRTNLEAQIEKADAAKAAEAPKPVPVLPGQKRLFE